MVQFDAFDPKYELGWFHFFEKKNQHYIFNFLVNSKNIYDFTLNNLHFLPSIQDDKTKLDCIICFHNRCLI
jgi:hypothetical protein